MSSQVRRSLGPLAAAGQQHLHAIEWKAWSAPQATTWTDHRERLARHGRLWAQDDLTYFRTSTVNWRL